jgi:hypothetical protein
MQMSKLLWLDKTLFSLKILLLSFSLLNTAKAQVPSIAPACNIAVAYVNGVLTSPEDAAINLIALRKTMIDPSTAGKRLLFGLVYNPSAGALVFPDIVQSGLGDVVQSAGQLVQQYGLTFADAFYALEASVTVGVAQLAGQDSAALRASIIDAKAKILKNSLTDTPAEYPLMLSRLDAIPSNIPIMLVGHSQGTLFVNQLYQGLKASKKRDITMVAAAAIAAVVPSVNGRILPDLLGGEDAHTTAVFDLVVLGVRALNPGPILNVNYYGLPNLLKDFSGHGMADTYLSDAHPQLRDDVKKRLTGSVAKLPFTPNAPDGSCGRGPDVEFVATGAAVGWTLPPLTTLSGLTTTDRDLFRFSGTANNSCFSEIGVDFLGKTFSQSSIIAPDASFYNVTLVSNPPDGLGGWNRRPCSTFVATKMISDPSDLANPSKVKVRIWANVTSRREQFSPFAFDRETQIRFDSGDPFSSTNGLPTGYYCQAGTTVSSQFVFQPIFIPSTCKARLKLDNSFFVPTSAP